MTRVLIVDDKEENLYFLRALLTGHGYIVEEAHDGAAALETAALHPPDIIISDLLMPVMDGFTLLRHWKADPRLQEAPFIVYTATYTEPANEQLALGLGADAFILKPAEPEDFLARLRQVEATTAAAPDGARTPPGDEKELLKLYSETLIRKLEDKTVELQRVNHELELDIARREMAEESTRRLAESQTAILNALPAHIALVDAQGVILSVNAVWRRSGANNSQRQPNFGVGENYLKVCDLLRATSEEDAETIAAGIRRVLHGEAKLFAFEYPCHSSKQQRWFRLLVTPVSESRAAGAVIMHLDITGKRLAEQAIRRQAHMLDHIGQAVIATDMEGCITYVNRFAGELYGWPPEEMLGRDIIEVTVAKISHSQATASMARLRAGEIWSGEFLVQRRDGVIFPVLVTDSPLLGEQGELLGIIGIFIDITERKRAEETLLQNQAFLTMASRVGRLGAWALEMPSLALSWSDEVRAIHEMPPDYVATVDAGIDFYAPEFRETIRDAITGCMRDGKPFDVELQIITSSNRRLWTRSIGEARRDPDGVITRVQGAFQDIADRKAADARLREQAMLLDVAREAILVRDLDDHIIFWNKGAERGYGWSAAEALGQQSAELLKTDPAKFQEATAALLATGEWQGELVKSTRDGREIIVEARWTLVRDAEGRPKSILSINNDITDRKRMEQQFFRAQRLESVGTLASGLAHDLNNVLAPILMCSSMLRMGLSAEKVETLITTIESSATRGSQIINKVLTFGRGVDGDRVPLNLREIVGEIVQIASETFPKNIRTEHHIAKDLAGIVGDPTQWHQVLLNLAVNARDAMPDGGVFRITAENLLVDEHYASMSDGLTSGPHIVLR